MALKINRAQIGQRKEIAANGTSLFKWNNPPSGVVSYFATASPDTPSGPHGTNSDLIGIVSVRHMWTKDNYNGEKKQVQVEVKNYGNEPAGYVMWQTWVTED